MATAVTPGGRVRLQRRTARRRMLPKAAWWAISIVFAALFIFPIYVALTSSLKGPKEAAQIPPTLFPHQLSFQNYADLRGNESSINVFHNIGNSVMVSFGATIATVVIATLGGYAFSKLRFPGSNVVFFATLATFMIPFQAIITPLYIVLKDLGLQNTLLGLGMVYVTFNLPFGLFLMRTPMIAPTKIYDQFPTITPDEAADLICEAIRSRPKQINTRLGTFGEVAYALAPKAVDQILHTAYKVFPDSAAARGEKDPNEKASMEQVAMANLMKGVHW